MPALPAIAAITGIVGGVSQIGQGNEQNATIRSQVDLEAQKFGWTKEQTEREYQTALFPLDHHGFPAGSSSGSLAVPQNDKRNTPAV